MSKPTSRIGGDFDYEAMEAFRAAYAQQLASPDQDEVANNTGLPTNVVTNTSPWIEHTGLWKYPSGKGPEDDLKAPFNPNEFLPEEVVDEFEEEDEEEDGDFMSDEELERLVDEILGEYEVEEDEDSEE